MLPISQPASNERINQALAWRDWLPTIVAAVLAAGAVVLLLLAFESVSAFERPAAVESLAGTTYWIASATIGACSTIAALMLTTVSLMQHLETRRMGPHFLFHLRLTVLGAIATIALAIATLLLTTFPLAGGADVRPPTWQIDAVFFGLQGLTALTVGGFAVVLSSLYATISDVFRNLPETWVTEILNDEAAEEADPGETAERAAERSEDGADRSEHAAERSEEAADVVVSQQPERATK